MHCLVHLHVLHKCSQRVQNGVKELMLRSLMESNIPFHVNVHIQFKYPGIGNYGCVSV
jgi:hypothetical protein